MVFSIVYAGFRLLVNLVAVQALGSVSSSIRLMPAHIRISPMMISMTDNAVSIVIGVSPTSLLC